MTPTDGTEQGPPGEDSVTIEITDPTCNDTGDGEPNETPIASFDLGTIDDCDSSGSSVAGILDGSTDQDWYFFEGDDSWTCSVSPTISTSDDVEVCTYFLCTDFETPSVTCLDGSADHANADGDPGCCSQGGGHSADIGCSGIDDSAFVSLLVTQTATSSECEPYTVDYNY